MPPRTKRNYKGSLTGATPKDFCQTPYYAIDPLLPFLPDRLIWEPAAGEGQLVRALSRSGFMVLNGDVQRGQNYFEYDCPSAVQVTNPPFSIKFPWLARAYSLGNPFALLMPFDTLAADRANKLFARYGVEVIIVNPRISFKMPEKGYTKGGATFATAWFTWGLNIGREITYAKVPPVPDSEWLSPLEKELAGGTN